MTTPLLADSEGRKIGKTEGNVIGITDAPAELFTKIMGLSDSAIISCFTLITTLPIEEIETKEKRLKSGENPIVLKKELAFQILSELNSPTEAEKAQVAFEQTFQERKPEYKLRIPLQATLAATIRPYTSGASISAAKRMIRQGGVDVNQKTVSNPSHKPSVGDKIKIGQQTFATVVKK